MPSRMNDEDVWLLPLSLPFSRHSRCRFAAFAIQTPPGEKVSPLPKGMYIECPYADIHIKAQYDDGV